MSDHCDRLETRSVHAREKALFRDFHGVMSIARPRAPALRRQLRGIELDTIRTRADLEKIPVLRKSDLVDLQQDQPPFGGLVATRTGALKRVYASPGPIYEPEGHAKDWWGAARAFYAAGFRKGQLVLNSFSYHLTPGGHIMENGAHTLGCAVIPAGTGASEQQVDVIAHLKPEGYCGTPDFLKVLLDKARDMKRDASSITHALVSGAALPGTLRAELQKRGVAIRQCYATADLGVIAYETSGAKGELVEGMVVNEGIILEIVRPGTDIPVAAGEVGEIVVTRLNVDYPLLRFGTGDLSAILPGPSPCGRTNMRIKGWLGRADQTTKVKGMFVRPNQIGEIAKRHPEVARLRLVVSRANEQDMMVLHAEGDAKDGLVDALKLSLQEITKLRGDVKIVKRNSLPNDGKVIADERPVG